MILKGFSNLKDSTIPAETEKGIQKLKSNIKSAFQARIYHSQGWHPSILKKPEKVGSSHLGISWHSEERFDKNRARQPPEAVLLWVQEQEARSRRSLHKESSQPPSLS